MLYLRKLLRASWLTEAWLFDVAATGASISFELYEAEGNGDAEAGTRASTVYRVRGVLTAASPEQQSSAVPLVPPEEPPGRSVFLDETFDAFKAAALSTIELRCVLPPLRETAFALQKGSGSGGSGWAGSSARANPSQLGRYFSWLDAHLGASEGAPLREHAVARHRRQQCK